MVQNSRKNSFNIFVPKKTLAKYWKPVVPAFVNRIIFFNVFYHVGRQHFKNFAKHKILMRLFSAMSWVWVLTFYEFSIPFITELLNSSASYREVSFTLTFFAPAWTLFSINLQMALIGFSIYRAFIIICAKWVL